MEFKHDLPDGITEWIEKTGKGEITRLERHVARREAWVVDVTRADGSVLEGFLRLERERRPRDPWSLAKETKIIEALGPTAVPVPAVYGRDEKLGCTLFERAPGRSDLDRVEDERQQRAVMEHFMQIVGEMHTLDIDDLGLDRHMAYKPTTAAEAAFGEVDLILRQWKDFLKTYRDPLITYGVQWLRNHVPERIARVSLVQGDTGPVNFLFDGDRVSAVIDFEWGHFGDPMEDLGNICVREFWNPSGGLTGLFKLYEQSSGIPYDRRAALYYRVHQNVRGMIPIHAVTVMAHPREPVAWFLAYRYIGDRATCEAIAEAMDIAIDKPEMPADDGEADALAEAAVYALANDVAPNVTGAFAQSRANDVEVLVRCMDRRRRYQAALADIERNELAELLGRRPKSAADGLRKLDNAIRKGTLDDADTLRYLTRRAYRDEWLYTPAVTLYPARNWSPID
jgi:aminoglycoside phosphotransferase (APT) family kinase protein